MIRAFIVLSSVYVIPAFLKIIFEGRDPNMRLTRKCSMFMLNLGAFIIQLGSILLCLMFQLPMAVDEKEKLHADVLRHNNDVIVPRAKLQDGYFNGQLMLELPFSLLLISLSYWENYVEGDFMICGKNISFKALKKHLHHSRGRLYIFASVWKVAWTIALAVLLQPGFNFNVVYSKVVKVQDLSGKHGSAAAVAMTTGIPKSEAGVHRLLKRQFTETIHDHLSSHSSTLSTLAQDIQPKYISSPSTNTQTDNNMENTIHPSTKTGDISGDGTYFSAETMKHFERFGVLYLQIISSSLLTYFGSTACKMCMQLVGFSLPLTLATPVAVAIVVFQNVYKFMPTGSFIWVVPETGSDLWMLHLAWIGVLWLSEIFIVFHIWFPSNGRMEKIDR